MTLFRFTHSQEEGQTGMFRHRRVLSVAGGVLCFLALVAFLQWQCRYDFLYAEQFRLFRWDAGYLRSFQGWPGGPVSLFTAFILQFFAYPGVGAVVVAGMFFLAAGGVGRDISSVNRSVRLPFFGVLAAVMLTALATETHYSYEQSWALIINLWVCACVVRVRGPYTYINVLLSLLLLLAFTGVMVYYAMAIIGLHALLTRPAEKWQIYISIAASLALFVGLVWSISTNDALHTWTLDAYYSPFLHAPWHSYWPLACLPVGMALASAMRRCDRPFMHGWSWYVGQIVVALALGGWYFSLCHTPGSVRVKKLEVWRWQGAWDKILAEDMPTGSIPLYANYQNLALAATGRLGDEVLNRPQCGTLGLQQVWQGAQQESDLLSDIFMQQGHVALAQKMAFTAMQSQRDLLHGRMLLRLIETNLILGAHDVAEKYIRILEQTLVYADRARAYRQYIGHPERVSADPLMGALQRCTRGCDYCPNDLEEGLVQVVAANPDYTGALHYLGSFYLLQHNMEAFGNLLRQYGDRPGLNPLPESFRKASTLLAAPSGAAPAQQLVP